MSDPFESPRALLKRARAHLSEYAYKHGQYEQKRPFQLLAERDRATGEEIRKVRVNKGYPVELGCIAFDAINCLRSAMDHAVFAATTALTATSFDPKTVKFPFGGSLDQIETELSKGRARNVPIDLHPVLMEFKPYKSGCATLYGFNEIRNENIHRVLSPVAAASNGMSIGGNGYIGSLHIINEWDAANRELTYAKGRNIDPGIQIKISVAVSFTESSGLPFSPVLGVLNTVADITQSILLRVEEETARLLSERPT